MTKFLYIISFILFIFSCSSKSSKAESTETETYTRINKHGAWGFINQKGDTVIPLKKYKFLNPIDEQGMILAKSNEKYGYINSKQDTLIPFIYEYLNVFSQGLASAKYNGKYGFIDRKGKVVIDFVYESESHFYSCKIAEAKLNNAYGFIDTSNRQVIPIQYEKVKNNKIDAIVSVMKNGKWAFFSCEGTQLTDFKFDEIIESYYDDWNYTFFKKGLCKVEVNGKPGYINNTFKEIVPVGTFDIAQPFRNHLAIVSKNGKYGIIDSLGNMTVPLAYDFIEHPREYSNTSDLFVIKKNGNSQILSKEGNPITSFDIKKFIWDSYVEKESYHRCYIITKNSGASGTISEKGVPQIPFEYQEIAPFNGKSVTIVKQKEKYGLTNFTGEIILPCVYDAITSHRFFEYFIVSRSGKSGILDTKGQQIIPLSYESITPAYYDKNNKFIVEQNGVFGIIDKNENPIIPIEFEEISNWVEYGPKAHFVTKHGKKGLIRRNGAVVIPTVYDEIFVDNSKLIKVKNNGKFGTVNWKNKIIHPIEFKEILWEWPYLTNKALDTVYLRKHNTYFSTDIHGNILEKNVSKTYINTKF